MVGISCPQTAERQLPVADRVRVALESAMTPHEMLTCWVTHRAGSCLGLGLHFTSRITVTFVINKNRVAWSWLEPTPCGLPCELAKYNSALGRWRKRRPTTNWGFSRIVGMTRESRLVELSDCADSACLPDYQPRDEKSRLESKGSLRDRDWRVGELCVSLSLRSITHWETLTRFDSFRLPNCQGVQPGNEPGDLAEQLVRSTMR
jgi:hypothetical protein